MTFYDDASGERVELSVTTWANWVAKTAALVQDELGRERADLVLIDLPTHWLGTVWLGAAWSVGLEVSCDPADATDADLVVCGPAGLEAYGTDAGRRDVVALSLRPMGARFADPLPPGVVDYGVEVFSQPDVFQPLDPPAPDDPAWRGLTQQQLFGEPTSEHVPPGQRLITDANPCGDVGRDSLVVPFATGGSTVWVANADPATWESHASQERATATWRVG